MRYNQPTLEDLSPRDFMITNQRGPNMLTHTPQYTNRTNTLDTRNNGAPAFRPPRRSRGGNGTYQRANPGQDRRSFYRQDTSWQLQEEVRLRVNIVHRTLSTIDIYRAFSRFGNLSYIKVEQSRGRSTQALLNFNPPPLRPFWEGLPGDEIRIDNQTVSPGFVLLEGHRHEKSCPSPVHPTVSFPAVMSLDVDILGLGTLTGENIMTLFQAVTSHAAQPSVFRVFLLGKRHIYLDFTTPTSADRPMRRYRIEISLTQVTKIHRNRVEEDRTKLVFSLESPPKFFIMEKAGKPRNDDPNQWSETDGLCRQTDIDNKMHARLDRPIQLCRPDPYIDPGRWLTFSLTLASSTRNQRTLDVVCSALRDFSISITNVDIDIIQPSESAVWDELDRQHTMTADTSFLADLHHFHRLPHLSWDIRYQLEVCISHGCLVENTFTEGFLHLLNTDTGALGILQNLAAAKQIVYDPLSILNDPDLRTQRRQRVPRGCALMHSISVTPTTLYVNTPSVEVSNRVIRKYSENTDRFLRVKFMDELHYGRLYTERGRDSDEVFRRFKRALINGIDIAGRHYEFLAFSNSQLRENGCYFFSPTSTLSIAMMRSWMGNFDHIRVIAKYASRIGQCFSTTRAITSIGMRPNVRLIDDIERNNYCFTDGVGKISPFLAQMIAEDYNLGSDYPSVFQFRMGGCKGVLVVDPTLTGTSVHIRKSQLKFDTLYQNLEIVRISSWQSATLNQQIILILSTLGVPDKVFTGKMQHLLSEIDEAMTNETAALRLLRANVDFNQITLSLSRLILDGFMQDPFVESLMQLWRAWTIKYLKEKSKIPVEEGALVFGCVDETATLRMDGEYPEIFLQITDTDPTTNRQYKTITGVCLLARNPSLHPGDIRVVSAVECPALGHIKNAVVFPQLGNRDLANMCSGGDLDGDDYLVIWDQSLIPTERNHDPMDYSAPEPLTSDNPVTTEDIARFFCEYMKNDSLGSIANAHRCFADYASSGVKDPRCLELAELHSRAVDYAKTGVCVQMNENLRPRTWPHFMEKPPHQSYISQKVLGQLYDEIQKIDYRPEYEPSFDQRILQAYDIEADMLAKAMNLKMQYDMDIRRVMARHDIKTEFEVWSAFVMSHNGEIRDYSFAEELGRVMSNLKITYQDLCFEHAGLTRLDRSKESFMVFVAAMYTVTAREVDRFNSAESETDDEEDDKANDAEDEFNTALNGVLDDENESEDESSTESEYRVQHVPLITFPWIFAEELGRIANGQKATEKAHNERGQSLSVAPANDTLHSNVADRSTADQGDKNGRPQQKAVVDPGLTAVTHVAGSQQNDPNRAVSAANNGDERHDTFGLDKVVAALLQQGKPHNESSSSGTKLVGWTNKLTHATECLKLRDLYTATQKQGNIEKIPPGKPAPSPPRSRPATPCTLSSWADARTVSGYHQTVNENTKEGNAPTDSGNGSKEDIEVERTTQKSDFDLLEDLLG